MVYKDGLTDTQEREHLGKASFRHAVYALLIVTVVGSMVGRIFSVRSQLGETPLLSANDRSRWCTIRALVDQGTYAIDDVIYKDRARGKRDREWYTIDMVRHKGPDGREHYYSSKPPLLATMLAWVYWGIQSWNGATFAERPFYLVRCILIIANVIPMAIYLWLLSRMADRYGTRSWARVFVVAAACYGTFLTTFAVTLNNHLPAAISVLVTLYVAIPIWRDDERGWYRFVLAGLFAAFAAANELPALSFLAVVGAALLIKSPSRTLLGFVPAVAVVAVSFFVTNMAAHDSWRPPYAHRGDGPLLATVEGGFVETLEQGKAPEALVRELKSAGVDLSPQTLVQPRLSGSGWMLWDRDGQDRLALSADASSLTARTWDEWYEFAGSYWFSDRKTGVDLGEPSYGVYAFHVLLGHHGIFSLTPIWLLSLLGLGLWLARGRYRMRGVAAMILGLALVCLVFYVVGRPLKDRNYGGVTCGFRWMFWFIPLWLLAMLPACDLISRRTWLRRVTLALLLVSVVSSAYASLNPWTHPWLYEYWEYLGWITEKV